MRATAMVATGAFSLLFWMAAGCSAPLTSAVGLPASRDVVPQKYVGDLFWAEGPALDRQGNLYVPNYLRMGTIGKFTPDGKASILIDLTQHLPPVYDKKPSCNGLKVDDNGDLIGAETGTNHIIRISKTGDKVEVLASALHGKRFLRLNDVAMDGRGNVYFSNPGKECVCRWNAADGSVDNVTPDELVYSNGIGVTPDGKYLVLASDRHQVLIMDLVEGKGRNLRVLIDFRKLSPEEMGPLHEPGYADGLVFDEAGRLYVAANKSGVVRVIEVPSGRLLATYDAGGKCVTNLHFYNGDLYVTAGTDHIVNRLKLGLRGWAYSKGCGY